MENLISYYLLNLKKYLTKWDIPKIKRYYLVMKPPIFIIVTVLLLHFGLIDPYFELVKNIFEMIDSFFNYFSIE